MPSGNGGHFCLILSYIRNCHVCLLFLHPRDKWLLFLWGCVCVLGGGVGREDVTTSSHLDPLCAARSARLDTDMRGKGALPARVPAPRYGGHVLEHKLGKFLLSQTPIHLCFSSLPEIDFMYLYCDSHQPQCHRQSLTWTGHVWGLLWKGGSSQCLQMADIEKGLCCSWKGLKKWI